MATDPTTVAQPWGIVPPDVQTDILDVQRKRALASALLQSSLDEGYNPDQRVGHYPVKYNPLQGIANLGKAFISSRMQKQADQLQADVMNRQVTYRQAQAQQMFPNDPDMQKNFVLDPEGTIKSGMEAKRGREQAQFNSDLEAQRKANETPPEVKEYQLWKSENPKGSYTDFLRIKTPAFAGFGMGGPGDQNLQKTAEAIARGDLPAPSGLAMRMPQGQALMAKVLDINPEYDAAFYGTKQKTLKDFSTGKQGQSVASFNKSIAHLGTLDKAVDALNNGDYRIVNSIGNQFGFQTGSDQATNFNTIKNVVGNEIVKGIVGGGGGVEDRAKAAEVINSANSPTQLRGAIKQYKELMKGQMAALRQEYESNTKKSDFDKFLMPETLSELKAQSQGSQPITKTIGGKTYVKQNGQWFQQ